MKILSLFDGISTARVALERAGIKIDKYYASEIDKYAIQIAQKNYPDTIQLGDIKNIQTGFFKEGWVNPNTFDLIIGGSPCQDLSIAKKNREGLKGCRSGLFYEMLRLIKEVKPKYFILENVNSMPKEAKAEITKELWGIEPVMINAALVSAQNRKRLFWVGKLVGYKYEQVAITQPEDRGILPKDILENGAVALKDYGGEKIKSNTVRTSGRGSGINDKHNWDTIRIGQIGKGGQADRIYSPEGKSVNLSANGGGRGAKTGLYAIPVALRNRGEGKKPEYNGTEKANAMTTVQTDSMVSENTIIRKLTPIECERLQSLEDDFTEGVSNSQRYKMLGNGMNAKVIEHILTFIK